MVITPGLFLVFSPDCTKLISWTCFNQNQFGAIWSKKRKERSFDKTFFLHGTNMSFPKTRLHFSLKSAKPLRSDTPDIYSCLAAPHGTSPQICSRFFFAPRFCFQHLALPEPNLNLPDFQLPACPHDDTLTSIDFGESPYTSGRADVQMPAG